MALDDDDNEDLRDVSNLSRYIKGQIVNPGETYYILLDEAQLAISRDEMRNPDVQVRLYGLLNSLLRKGNIDVYVTGSNSKMLSKDVATEFRGRGDVVEVHPLSFSEYYSHVGGDKVAALDSYLVFGGMPFTLSKNDAPAKREYLGSLFDEVYMALRGFVWVDVLTNRAATAYTSAPLCNRRRHLDVTERRTLGGRRHGKAHFACGPRQRAHSACERSRRVHFSVTCRLQNAFFRRVRFSSPGQTRRRPTEKRILDSRGHGKAHSVCASHQKAHSVCGQPRTLRLSVRSDAQSAVLREVRRTECTSP